MMRSIFYTSGNFGKNLIWGFTELTLLYLLTDVVKFDPLFAGTLIFASIMINIVLDPLVGLLTDRLTGPLGSKTFLIAFGAPVCASSFALLYSLPAIGWVSAQAVLVCLMIFRAGFSLMDAPHNALIASVSSAGNARSTLAASRFAFGSLAGFAIAGLLAIAEETGETSPVSFALIGMVVGAVSATIMLGSAFAAGVVEIRPRQWSLDLSAWMPVAHWRNAIPVAQVALLALILYAGVPMYGKMFVYQARLNATTSLSAATMATMMVFGQVVGTVAWTLFSRRMQLRPLLRTACASVAAMSMIALALRDQPYAEWFTSFGFGLCASGIYIFIWVLAADCADWARSRASVAASTLVFSIVIVGLKIGQGFGTFLSGWALATSGYVPDALPSTDTGVAVTALQTGMPFIAALLALVLLPFYRGAARASD